MRKYAIKRLLAVLMSAIMVVSMLCTAGIGGIAKAATAPDKTVACLGTSIIKAPKAPENENSPWTGSYVWFGRYDGNPVKYRVLAPKTTVYGGTTMFLDCDGILYEARFDEDDLPNPGAQKPYEWKYSDVKAGLNDSAFLTKPNGFASIEREAITSSTVSGYKLNTGDRPDEWFVNYIGLTGEKVFLLDYGDVVNPEYGYTSDSGFERIAEDGLFPWSRHDTENRYKDDSNFEEGGWWLRADGIEYDGAGNVLGSGYIDYECVDAIFGVSPAFNINLPSVIFSSVVSGIAGKDNAEYKLTLADSNLKVGIQSGKTLSASGSKITVPYVITGKNASKATQVSVLILDKTYTAGDTNSAKIKYYGKLNIGADAGFSTTGTGTFTLPSGLSLSGWGSSYYVYLLAEDVNGIHETDYASHPVKLTKPGTTPGKVSLSFDLNGGTSGAPSTVTVTVGSTATVPKSSPVRTGFWFLGWAESASAKEAIYKSNSEITMNENFKLYAVWKYDGKTKFRLSFDRNGGSGNAPTARNVAPTAVVAVPSCSITREGYYFMGWSITRGGEVAYKSGSKLSVGKDTVLYAVWKPRTNTITFNANYGTGTLPATIKVLTGKTATIGKSTMSRNGYWFLGWSESKNETEATYKTGSEISVKKDTVLYAVWKKK